MPRPLGARSDLSFALDVLTFLFRSIPELVELVSRWLDGEEAREDDPVYALVKGKLDASLDRLEKGMQELDR